MKRWSNRHQPRLITEISVTPLLDLVFVLLLVFMVAAPLMNQDASVSVPVSQSAGPSDVPTDVVRLTLNRENVLALDGTGISREELVDRIKAMLTTRPSLGVVVEIHRDLPVQTLVDLMDGLTAAGVKKTSVVATQAAGT
jgi:biopolymer transport protein ExbD